jgi:hypothetical protein
VSQLIEFRAGRNAYERIMSGGFTLNQISVLAGASGGPKWLVLSGIDRVLPGLFKGRQKPLFTIGSSIGAWRFAALSQKNPLEAIGIFEEKYIAQQYADEPFPQEVTDASYEIIDAYLSRKGIDYALNHPYMRMNIITAYSKGLASSDKKILLSLGFLPSVILNLVNRKLLAMMFSRVVFSDNRDKPPFSEMKGFNTSFVNLVSGNLREAIMASGSIPFVMNGVRTISSAPKGTYRDGGTIDYHLDIPFLPADDGLVLYPHFYHRIIPGWFDKSIPWRKASGAALDNTLLIYPSQKFIDSLPNKKIPDRNDFYLYKGNDKERFRCWNDVVKKGKELGSAFSDSIESRVMKKIIKPL